MVGYDALKISIIFKQKEINFDTFWKHISCLDEIGDKIDELRKEFLAWLHDKGNDHQYWMYKDGKKFGVAYGAEAFVYWLNNVYENEEKAALVDESDEIISKVQKKIYF